MKLELETVVKDWCETGYLWCPVLPKHLQRRSKYM